MSLDIEREIDRLAARAERELARLEGGGGPSRYRLRKQALQQFGPRSSWPKCGAKTRRGTPCQAAPARDLARDPVAGWYKPCPSGRCRLHGGLSTGPRTPEGKKRIGEAARARYFAEMRAQGWLPASQDVRDRLAEILRVHSVNATRLALGVTRHDVRRVITGLPLDPSTLDFITSRLDGGPAGA